MRILRSRIDANRIVPTPAEKAELLRIGESIEHDIADVMHVVLPSTYRKWVRQRRKGYRFVPSGRPCIPEATRKVFPSPSTYHPDFDWVMQQARNAAMWMDDEGTAPRFLIRDRDRKYPDEFDAFWKPDVRCIRIPIKAPMANAFCETYIGKMKQEVLNHFICFSRGHLDYILRVWHKHYHEQRPHRGVGRDNTVLDEAFVPKTEGAVRCKSELGGLIKSYYREAA